LGMGIGDWAQSPIPNPQSPIPNPQSPNLSFVQFLKFKYYLKVQIKMNDNNMIYNNNYNNINPLIESKEFKLLLSLLDKLEQILSIINLPESSISKYNTLKKMTFDILNLEFRPLERKFIPSSNPENDNNNLLKNANDEMLYILHFLNIKKSMLIDLILDYIKNNNNNIEQEKNLNYFLTSLTEIYNLSGDVISSKTPDDIMRETKSEEAKIAELFTKIDEVFVNSFDSIKQMRTNYENELIRLKENYNRDLSELKNSLEKNSNLENDLFKERKENEKKNYYLDKMSLLINESYEKYKLNSQNQNEGRSIAYKDGAFDEDIMKLEFLKQILDKFSNEPNQNLTKENMRMENNYNFNYKYNSPNNKNIYSEELINDINNSLPEIQKESDIFHKNFCDLMNYIETNIEDKIV